MILLDDHEINNEIYIILVNYIKEPPPKDTSLGSVTTNKLLKQFQSVARSKPLSTFFCRFVSPPLK